MPPRAVCRLVLLLVFAVPACAERRCNCVPLELVRTGRFVDLSAPPGEDQPAEHGLVTELMQQMAGGASPEPPPGARSYKVLALSGGGANGAYTAGVLNGWTRAGDRPEFDIVTGISTGGLIATLAFLGPAYDGQICRLYTDVDSRDIYRRRPTVSLLWSDSAATSAPLRETIDDHIDCALLQRVAAEHARGRRLYVGTTDLDNRRLVIWDMGVIAGSGRADALALYRKIVLASASVPGFFPPVSIDVTVNGRRYSELHADGGATSQVFVPASVLKPDREAVRAGRKPLAGSEVFVVIAGKLYADPDCVEQRIKGIAGSAVTSITSAQARNDLIRIWTICQLTGMRYYSTAIPQDFPIPQDSLEFDPAAMRRIFELGVCHGQSSRSWRATPPGTEPDEQMVPRAGTEFLTPVIPVPASTGHPVTVNPR